jgi:hypothetical protein
VYAGWLALLDAPAEGEDQVQLGDHVLRILGETQLKEGSDDEDGEEDVAIEEKDDLVSVIALLLIMETRHGD